MPNLSGAPLSKEERTIAMWTHLAAFAGHFFPLLHIVAPLILWQSKREMSPFVDAHGRESVNAQISLTIYFIISIILCVVVIGIFLLAILYVGAIVCVILAAIAANEGRMYRYPFILRLLK